MKNDVWWESGIARCFLLFYFTVNTEQLFQENRGLHPYFIFFPNIYSYLKTQYKLYYIRTHDAVILVIDV